MTLPPPGWAVLHVNKVTKPENEKLIGRSLVDIARLNGAAPVVPALGFTAASLGTERSGYGVAIRDDGLIEVVRAGDVSLG